MQIPRVRATIVYADGSKVEVDRIFEAAELAVNEYNRLIGFADASVSGTVSAELCGHFEGGEPEPCEVLMPTITWGGDDVDNP